MGCGCSCSCLLRACTPNVTVSGNGSSENPYCIAVDEAACSCYVRHLETVDGGQLIDEQSFGGGSGYRADPTQIVWDTDNSCGELTDDTAMLTLHLNWGWIPDSVEPVIDCGPAYPNIPIALFVGVYGEGFPPPELPIAADTRLALGGQFAYIGGDVSDYGSISVPLNIFPAGPDFTVWVAHNSESSKYINMRADIYTVCGCSCVL